MIWTATGAGASLLLQLPRRQVKAPMKVW